MDFLLTSSTSGRGLRLRSWVGSGAFVRLRVASCSNVRRLADISVVVVVILRTCDACDPVLLSPEVFRSRSVAALAGRDCCWRRAAEARRSATETPREGGLEAIARVVHSSCADVISLSRLVVSIFQRHVTARINRYSACILSKPTLLHSSNAGTAFAKQARLPHRD
jgi:hypothetical protein